MQTPGSQQVGMGVCFPLSQGGQAKLTCRNHSDASPWKADSRAEAAKVLPFLRQVYVGESG